MRVVLAATHLGVALEAPLPALSADAVEVRPAADAREGRPAVAAVCEGVADAHTRASSRSGSLGGMPLGIACVELRPPAALAPLGLRTVPPTGVRFVDVRDADPGEADLVARAGVVALDDVAAGRGLPDGTLYVHLDADVVDGEALPDLRCPVPGGPTADAVLAAVRGLLATDRVVGLGVSLSWRPEVDDDAAGSRAAFAAGLRTLVAA